MNHSQQHMADIKILWQKKDSKIQRLRGGGTGIGRLGVRDGGMGDWGGAQLEGKHIRTQVKREAG